MSPKPKKPGKPKKAAKPKSKPALKALPGMANLIADDSANAHVNVVFSSGLGQLAAILFRNGALISQGSVTSSGAIALGSTQSGDVISINGVATGSAVVTIDVSTSPATPLPFAAGSIHHLFVVL